MLEREKRSARRVPVNTRIRIVTSLHGETFYATAKDISVSSIAFETEYVPRHGEELELTILPGNASVKPLRTLVQVTNCMEVEPGLRYDVVACILRILE